MSIARSPSSSLERNWKSVFDLNGGEGCSGSETSSSNRFEGTKSCFFLYLENTLLRDFEGDEGLCLSGEVVPVGLKHLMVELGWNTRTAREAAMRHFSPIVVIQKKIKVFLH